MTAEGQACAFGTGKTGIAGGGGNHLYKVHVFEVSVIAKSVAVCLNSDMRFSDLSQSLNVIRIKSCGYNYSMI